MFTRVFALLPLALLASASHLAARDNTVNSCNTGDQYCCNQSLSLTRSVPDGGIIDIIAAVIELAAGAGSDCSALSLSECTQAPVCCENVHQNGLINVGCSPILI